MTAVDQYVSDLTSHLSVSARRRRRIESEIRDHFDDAIAHHVAAGSTKDEATAQTIVEFGSSSALAAQLNAEAGTAAMRHVPLVTLSAGIAVVAGFLVAATTQPNTSPTKNATPLVQIAFFAAVLAFQVALVAGACATSRATALRHRRFVGGDDRTFVRRCASIAAAALLVAAAGWAIAIGVSMDALAHSNAATEGAGIGIMLTAAVVGYSFVARLRVNATDESDEIGNDEVCSAGGLGFGERAIGIVRRHPAATCGVAVLLSSASAMSHAETTLVGSLPWGIAEGAAVVVGFVVLGPALHLRRARVA